MSIVKNLFMYSIDDSRKEEKKELLYIND